MKEKTTYNNVSWAGNELKLGIDFCYKYPKLILNLP